MQLIRHFVRKMNSDLDVQKPLHRNQGSNISNRDQNFDEFVQELEMGMKYFIL